MDNEDNKKTFEEKKDEVTKKLAVGALAVTTAIGASVAAETPPSFEDIDSQTAVVLDIGDYGAGADVDMDLAGDESSEEDEKKQKKSATIGSIVMAPIYFVGMGLLQLLELLAAGWNMPIIGSLIRWALFTALVTGTVATGLKVAFPDIPLKKLLAPKRIGGIIVGTTAISAICAILPMFGGEAAQWASWIRLAGGTVMIGTVAYIIVKFRNKIHKKNA